MDIHSPFAFRLSRCTGLLDETPNLSTMRCLARFCSAFHPLRHHRSATFACTAKLLGEESRALSIIISLSNILHIFIKFSPVDANEATLKKEKCPSCRQNNYLIRKEKKTLQVQQTKRKHGRKISTSNGLPTNGNRATRRRREKPSALNAPPTTRTDTVAVRGRTSAAYALSTSKNAN